MGGHFTQINGQSRGRIAMLHQDGTLDPTFSTANAADAAVACIAVQADRRILISGQFTKIAGVNRPAIARLESSGDLDTSFVPPVSSTFIRSVGPTDEGTILIAGSFSSYNSQTRRGFAEIRPGPGSSILEASPDSLKWKRSGAVPDFHSVKFESSPDGKNWTLLGNAIPTVDGWALNEITLPAGFIRAKGFSSVSNRFGGTVRVNRLYGRSPTPLESWREEQFGSLLPEGSASNLADPDKDGLPNLLEYAFERGPKDASSREVPSWVPDGSDYLWEMERPAVLGVGYGAEWSTTLESGDWHDAEDLSDSETLRFRVSSADKPRLFFRLKVSND